MTDADSTGAAQMARALRHAAEKESSHAIL